MEFYKLTYIDHSPNENIVFSQMTEEETLKKAETELTLMVGEGNFQITEFRKLDAEEKTALEEKLESMLPEDSDKTVEEVIAEAANTTPTTLN